MLGTPFSPWPSYTPEEIEAVSRVLKSNRVNYWTGNECREFEKEFAAYVGTEHAVALANGTLALELILRALDIGPDDDVIVTPRSFVASASCVATLGARPVFADVDANSQNITAETVRSVLTAKTKAVICVHLAGLPCDMDGLKALADEYDLAIIEDCAQAHGARHKGRSVGSIGHAAAWSFCQDKIITTGGEGGMVTTNDKELWSRMWSYKDHGKSWEGVYERKHLPGFPWRHDSFGSNFRMMEMQAVIGRLQLTKLDEWVDRRRHNANVLDGVLKSFDCIRQIQPTTDYLHAYYRYDAFIRPRSLREGWSRDKIIAALSDRGVPGLSGSCPEIYLEKAFQDAGMAPIERLPVAKELGESSIQFLVHPTLTDEEMHTMGQIITDVLAEAGLQ